MEATTAPRHLTASGLEAGLADVAASPRGTGTVEMIVRRPAVDVREVLEVGELTEAEGLVGDSWAARPSKATADGSPHPGRQLTLMNARFAQLVAGERAAWPLAGDQLFVDLDLSVDALAVGSRLALGSAVIEVSDQAHNGCVKFAGRYGRDAHQLVWSPEGRARRLRGCYARVVVPGTVRQGDVISPLPA